MFFERRLCAKLQRHLKVATISKRMLSLLLDQTTNRTVCWLGHCSFYDLRSSERQARKNRERTEILRGGCTLWACHALAEMLMRILCASYINYSCQQIIMSPPRRKSPPKTIVSSFVASFVRQKQLSFKSFV